MQIVTHCQNFGLQTYLFLLARGGKKIHNTKSYRDGVSQKCSKDLRSIHHIGLCIINLTGWGGGVSFQDQSQNNIRLNHWHSI